MVNKNHCSLEDELGIKLKKNQATGVKNYSDIGDFVKEVLVEFAEENEIADFMKEAFAVVNKYDKTLIMFPRGHSKSTMFTYILPLFILYHNHDATILIARENATMAESSVRAIRTTIEANPRLNLKPSTPWTDQQLMIQRKTTWVPMASVKGCGFDVGVTGGHFDYIIFDDVESRENTKTDDTIRNHIETMNTKYLKMDKHKKKKGTTKFIYICTPKRQNDIRSQIEKNSSWKKHIRHAITRNGVPEVPKYHIVKDDGGVAIDIAFDCSDAELAEYKVLWPTECPLKYLLRQMIGDLSADHRDMSYRDWLMEYQFIVRNPSESPFDTAWLDDCYYETTDLEIIKAEGRNLKIFQTIDLASSLVSGSSYTVILTGGIDTVNGVDRKLYLLEYFHERIDPVRALDRMEEKIRKWNPQKVYVESNAHQRITTLLLQRTFRDRIQPFFTQIDKKDRICQLAPLFQNGKIGILRDMKELIHEYETFDPGPGKIEADILDCIDFMCRTEFHGYLSLPFDPTLITVDHHDSMGEVGLSRDVPDYVQGFD
jgi:phage terminase large subunit-like protein